jgi:hypothetical protein
MWQYFTMLALKTVANLIFFSNLLSVQVNLGFGLEKNAAWSLESTTRSPTVPPLSPRSHTHGFQSSSPFCFFFSNQVLKSSLEHEFKVFVQF